MQTEVYIVLCDFDNGLWYEDWVCWNKRFIGVAQSEYDAQKLIQSMITEDQIIDYNKGSVIVVKEWFEPSHVETTKYYIQKYVLESKPNRSSDGTGWIMEHKTRQIY